MRKLKKRLAALGVGLAVMATSVMSMGASAESVSDDKWTEWPAYFVPYKGEFYADTTVVCVRNIKWSHTQKTAIADRNPNVWTSMEFEFRPQTPTKDPHNIWSGTNGAMLTNIPGGSFEFQLWDRNDVTVVFPNLSNCVPETSYYATQAMTPQTNGATNVSYIFECELGRYGLVDSTPIAYSEYPGQTSFAYWGRWEHSGVNI